MKAIPVIILIAFWVLSCPLVYATNQAQVSIMLAPFFNALKSGNLPVIKEVISGELSQEKRILLEKNKGYSNFLKKYYRGAEFKIVNTEELDGKLAVDVEVLFPDGSTNTTTIFLSNVVSGNQASMNLSYANQSWRIIDESNKMTKESLRSLSKQEEQDPQTGESSLP